MWEVGTIEEFISTKIVQPQELVEKRKLSDDHSPTERIIQTLTNLQLL
jgi:hypothetical protein